VSYTVAGAATAGIDYTTLSGSVTINAGDTSATIPVPVIDDTDIEGDETVIVTLTSVTSASATLGAPVSATNTITDNDIAVVGITNTTDSEEPGTNGLFTVSQSTASINDTVISYVVAGTATPGVDYVALSGSLTINAGDTIATIPVPVIDDTQVEGDEAVIVTLTTVTNGAQTLNVSVIATNTILDDDVDINDRVAQAFQAQVHNYISRRLTLHARSSPSIHRRLTGCEGNTNALSGNVNLGGNNNGVSGSLAFASGEVGCEPSHTPYVWAEAEFSYFRDDNIADTAVQSSGNYYIAYAGISMPVNEHLTIGLMGQVDWLEDRLESNLGETSGTGWAIGPYLSSKLSENLQLDLRALWGTSNNDTHQLLFGSNFAGSFDTERWIIEGILSGKHEIEEYTLKPSARLFYMSENWDDYTVSDNARTVAISGGDTEIGNLSAALEIKRKITNANLEFETFLSGEAFWTFQDPGIINSAGINDQSEDISGQLSAGMEIQNENNSLILEVTYGGFGSRDLESLGGSISLSHRF